MAASRARTAAPPTASRTSKKSNTPMNEAAVSRPAPRVAPPIGDTPPPAAPASNPLPTPIGPDAIAERAYYIWLRKGRPFGQDDQNWIDAEAELHRERAENLR